MDSISPVAYGMTAACIGVGLVAWRTMQARRQFVKRLAQSNAQARPLIIGHRGFGAHRDDHIVENTVKAFRRALADGISGIETDVQVTKDGSFILYHDYVLQGRPVADYTLEEIRAVKLEEGERIPTLFELMDAVRSSGRSDFYVILELKDKAFMKLETVRMLLTWLRAQGFLQYVKCFSDFDHIALVHVRHVLKELCADGITTAALFNRDDAILPDDCVEQCIKLGVEEIHCRSSRLSKESVAKICKAGLRLMAWFPSKPEDRKGIEDVLALGPGFFSICTNRPEILADIFAKQEKATASSATGMPLLF